ncbi:ABC transporter ATP-binding protein, partial [Flavobacterium sp. ST-87]
FQDPFGSLSPRMSIADIIAEGLSVHPPKLSREESEARVVKALEDVGMKPDTRYRYPHEFSGGQRQRVMIAMALANEPDLLIADEPTTALDVTVQAQILELLRDISETSKTALMLITHDLGVVAETCTRMITMYAGEVIEDATVDEALVRPLHPYTSGLLRSLPHLSPRHGRLPSIRGRG